METPETWAFEDIFGRDVATLYVAGMLETEDLFNYTADVALMRMVETCSASESMPRTTLQLARNLYYKWSEIVAEVAIYDKLQHGTPTVELQGIYLR